MDDEEPVVGGGAEGQREEDEIVDGVVVLASARAIEPLRQSTSPPLRAVAAVAATGFVAGAATAAMLGRRHARRRAGRAVGAHQQLRPAGEAFEVVASRRYVVDVHMLARR
jgi:hypothetical protein